MCTVAIIGPDGAGKSTITRRLERELPIPTKYVYMGVNLEASHYMLPTTRLIVELKRWRGGRPDMAGPADPARAKPRSTNLLKCVAGDLKSSMRLANLMAEEWFRQILTWYYQRRGYVVLFDRHFFSEYYASEIAVNGAGRPLANRIHGAMLKHLYPRPDFIICLDAPAEVLFARKGEGTIELLARRRQEYLQLRHVVARFATVDATLPEDEVTRRVAELVVGFHAERSGRAPAADRGRGQPTV